MPRSVELLDEARLELEEAFRWYLSRSVRAAAGFLYEVDRGLRLVAESPSLWREFEQGSRRYLLHNYPYALVYQERGERLVVIAVAHHKRRPSYWKARRA